MLRITTRAALALGLACALAACSREDEAEKQAPLQDSSAMAATTPVAAELAVWDVRFDEAGADATGFQMAEQPGGGWTVTAGSSAGVAWRDGDMVDGGPFDLSATLAAHSGAGQGYGIFVGGRHLNDPDRAYTAFLIRGDGQYRVERRENGQTRSLLDWTPSTALKPAAHGAEPEPNTLDIRVGPLATQFMANGVEVKAVPNEEAQPYGTAGLRLEKGADLTVSRFEMQGQGTGDNARAPVPRTPIDSQPSLPR